MMNMTIELRTQMITIKDENLFSCNCNYIRFNITRQICLFRENFHKFKFTNVERKTSKRNNLGVFTLKNRFM